MALINGKKYKESIKKLRPNIYKWGKLISDVTENKSTRLHIQSVQHSYDAAFDENEKHVYTHVSALTNKPAHRWNTLMQSAEDIIAQCHMKRAQFQYSGTCQGATCVGWSALNALWAVTHEIDNEYKTEYHQVIREYFKYIEENAFAVAGALTDAKGNRSVKPLEQKNADSFLRIVKKTKDGIIVSGCKAQICGVAASHEILCLPGGVYDETEKDYAVAFAVPRDAEGLTIVETRRPSDTRDEETGWDSPKIGNITQAFLLFENVFVPNSRIFISGEYKYTSRFIEYFSSIY